MALDVVQGKDAVLSMMVDSVYYPVFCGTNVTYEIRAEMIQRTGPTSGGSRQFMRRLEEHFTLVTGLTKIENDSESLSWFYLAQTGNRREVQTFRLEFSNEAGDDVTISGTAAIGTMTIDGPVDTFSTGTMEIYWDTPDQEVIPGPTIPVVQDPLYLTLLANNTTVSSVLLTAAGVELLEVCLEGLQHDVVTPTPGNREVTIDYATGVLTFNTSEVVNRDVYVLYQK